MRQGDRRLETGDGCREAVDKALLQSGVEDGLLSGDVSQDVADGLQSGRLEGRDEIVCLQAAI